MTSDTDIVPRGVFSRCCFFWRLQIENLRNLKIFKILQKTRRKRCISKQAHPSLPGTYTVLTITTPMNASESTSHPIRPYQGVRVEVDNPVVFRESIREEFHQLRRPAASSGLDAVSRHLSADRKTTQRDTERQRHKRATEIDNSNNNYNNYNDCNNNNNTSDNSSRRKTARRAICLQHCSVRGCDQLRVQLLLTATVHRRVVMLLWCTPAGFTGGSLQLRMGTKHYAGEKERRRPHNRRNHHCLSLLTAGVLEFLSSRGYDAFPMDCRFQEDGLSIVRDTPDL